uniref:Receptor protein-tyrosine kinase n=2 Tax=Tetranychus urticae TaxID=32264 RepID=T1KPM7_TETUR
MTLPDKGNDIEKPSDNDDDDGGGDGEDGGIDEEAEEDDEEGNSNKNGNILPSEYDTVESNILGSGSTGSKNGNNNNEQTVNHGLTRKTPKNQVPQSAKDSQPYLKLIGKLRNVTRTIGSKVRLKCSFRGYPLPIIRWLKNEAPIEPVRGKLTIKLIPSNGGRLTSRLLINNLDIHDTGYYKCEATNKHVTLETLGILVVTSDTGSSNLLSNSIPIITDYPNSLGHFNGFHQTQSKPSSSKAILPSSSTLSPPSSPSTFPLSPALSSSSSSESRSGPKCSLYVGKLCSQFIGNRSIYLESEISQEILEENLAVLFEMIATSHQISHQCHRFAISSVCFYNFPVCRTEPSGQLGIRKICRDECEILESSICRKEYSMARNIPVINANLLPKCTNLPILGAPGDSECVQLGVPSSVRPLKDAQVCFSENGREYRGIVDHSTSGRKCLPWSVGYNTIHYEELIGGHNYCRNPDGIEAQPWCLVDENLRKREFCDIPRCEDTYRLYFLLTPILAAICGFLIIFIVIIYRQVLNRKSSVASYMTTALRTAQYSSPISPVLCKRSPAPLWVEYDPNRYSETVNPQSPTPSNQLNQLSDVISEKQGKLIHYPMSSIKFEGKLCESDLGDILMGELLIPQGVVVPVAIRTLREDSSPALIENFKSEAASLASLQHTNIVCLLGVCFTDRPLCMMFELMAEGNLLGILQAYNPRKSSSLGRSSSAQSIITLEIQDLLHISIQIAAGMEYLSSKHFTHRDLACRNCLVSDYLTIKISNFRLNREDYSSDYYCIPNNMSVPIRWLPPESIFYEKFTSASDVWSFGVVLWEIFSYGCQPYTGFSNEQVIDLIRDGHHLSCPEDCPPHFYSIMSECWKREPGGRPTFTELHNKLKALQAVENVRSARHGFPRVGPLRSGSGNISQYSGSCSPAHLTRNPIPNCPLPSPRKVKRPLVTYKESSFEAAYSKLSFPLEKSSSFGFV